MSSLNLFFLNIDKTRLQKKWKETKIFSDGFIYEVIIS